MENQEQKRIIEVNGVKMEIDLRNAKVVENYKVGDYVKVLIKEYNSYKSYIGNIIGFDNFEKTKEKKKQSCDFCVICNLRPDLLVWYQPGDQ